MYEVIAADYGILLITVLLDWQTIVALFLSLSAWERPSTGTAKDCGATMVFQAFTVGCLSK